MWQIFSGLISETAQAIGVLLGSKDYRRELQKAINSSERFLHWGQESNSPIDYKEALDRLKDINMNVANNHDKIKIADLKASIYVGIIESKETEMTKFLLRMEKKYDKDDYMEDIISAIHNRMKELQAIIAAAENNDNEQLKLLLGDKKTIQIRPEEIALDARKEYDAVEDDYIMKKSVKENKAAEINNYKTILVAECDDLILKVKEIRIDIEAILESADDLQKDQLNGITKSIREKMETAISKLNKTGIPVKLK